MYSFSTEPSFQDLYSPRYINTTKRFSKLKQNVDANNIKANNYRLELERSYMKASRNSDYFYKGTFFNESPSTSSYIQNKYTQNNFNSCKSKPIFKKKYGESPSATFNQKWNTNRESLSNNYNNYYSNFYDSNYAISDQSDYKKSNDQNIFNSYSNSNINISNEPLKNKSDLTNSKKSFKNDSSLSSNSNKNISRNKKTPENSIHLKSNQSKLSSNSEESVSPKIKNDPERNIPQKKNKEVIFTPNRNQNYIRRIIQNEDSENQKFDKTFENEDTVVKNQNIKVNDEMHSSAYTNAINSVNSRMREFNEQFNTGNYNKKVKKIKNDENQFENISQKDFNIVKHDENEEENELKKKQRDELEEIKSLYNLVEKKLKKIQEESKSSNTDEIEEDAQSFDDSDKNLFETPEYGSSH